MNYIHYTAVFCGMLALPYGCAPVSDIAPSSPEGLATSDRVNVHDGRDFTADDKTQISFDEKLKDSCGLPPLDAFFDANSAQLKDADNKISLLAQCLTSGELKNRIVRIVGYTDPFGTAQYNKKLGRSRAQSVASALENEGVKRSKIILLSQGNKYSVGENAKGFAFDRRVEIHLAD